MGEPGWLDVSLRHRIGGLGLDIACVLTQPWTVLFAPSGSGKSTVLRLIAGLVRPDAGHVVWTAASGTRQVLTDTAAGVFVAPHRREIRFVGQEAALFPHRSVLGNVTYGSRDQEVVEEVLEICGVGALRGKMPTGLSGGERQRVAIARAIAAPGSRFLLLDEPFSGLDTAGREEMVARLRPWLAQRGVPVIQVTHDIGEVFALGAEVVRMHAGRIAAQGPAESVLAGERRWLTRRLMERRP